MAELGSCKNTLPLHNYVHVRTCMPSAWNLRGRLRAYAIGRARSARGFDLYLRTCVDAHAYMSHAVTITRLWPSHAKNAVRSSVFFIFRFQDCSVIRVAIKAIGDVMTDMTVLTY